MATTTTRTTADGVTTEELAAGPMSAPKAPAPAPPLTLIEIPATGTPQEIALKVLAMVLGGDEASTSFRDRASAAQAELEGLLEPRRLHGSLRLDQYVSRCAVKIRLRNVLIGRADQIDGKPGTQPPDLSAECHSLVRAVKRWEDGQDLRVHRARLIGSATRELQETTTKLRTELPSTARESHGSSPDHGHHATGLVAREDAWLRHYESALRRRAELRSQLDRLGTDRTARAKAVASAIAAAGASSVVARVAPQMPASRSRVDRVLETLGRLALEIGATDKATRRSRRPGRHADPGRGRARGRATVRGRRPGRGRSGTDRRGFPGRAGGYPGARNIGRQHPGPREHAGPGPRLRCRARGLRRRTLDRGGGQGPGRSGPQAGFAAAAAVNPVFSGGRTMDFDSELKSLERSERLLAEDYDAQCESAPDDLAELAGALAAGPAGLGSAQARGQDHRFRDEGEDQPAPRRPCRRGLSAGEPG